MRLSGQARRGEAFRNPPGSKDSNGKEESSGAADPLLGYLFKKHLNRCHIPNGYNLPMSSTKIIMVLVALAIGIGLGLVYGWVIDPVEYTDVTPDVLREDYRVDYVLMTAEAYQTDFDADAAARRIAQLGSQPPAEIVTSALTYANINGFTQDEIRALQTLLTAMQTYQPDDGLNP